MDHSTPLERVVWDELLRLSEGDYRQHPQLTLHPDAQGRHTPSLDR